MLDFDIHAIVELEVKRTMSVDGLFVFSIRMILVLPPDTSFIQSIANHLFQRVVGEGLLQLNRTVPVTLDHRLPNIVGKVSGWLFTPFGTTSPLRHGLVAIPKSR